MTLCIRYGGWFIVGINYLLKNEPVCSYVDFTDVIFFRTCMDMTNMRGSKKVQNNMTRLLYMLFVYHCSGTMSAV